MKQMKVLGVLAVAMTLGLTACGGTKECATHKWGKWTVTKEATCTEAGEQERVCEKCKKKETKAINPAHKYGDWTEVTPSTCQVKGKEKRVCSVCQHEEERDLDLADHTWGDWEEVTAPTCTEKGSHKHICSVCGAEESEDVAATGHTYAKVKDAEGNDTDEDVVAWTVEPTCNKGGTGKKTCTVCGAQTNVTSPALGHDLELLNEAVEPAEGKAAVRIYHCKRCDDQFLGFKASEVTTESKARLRIGDDGGARFWGRPIGNDVPLNDDGDPDRDNHPSIFNKQQTGDYFEYVFDLTEEEAALMQNVRCYCDAKPADYLGRNGIDFWANTAGSEDWTRGRYIDDNPDHLEVDTDGNPVMVDVLDENGQPTGEKVQQGKEITDYRYVLYVDDQIQEFDGTACPVPRSEDRAEYMMPFTFNFHKGTNKVSLRMAGGYRSVFYNFIFRPFVGHEHVYGEETAQTDEVLSTIKSCVDGDETRINWSAKKFNAEASQVGTADSTENGSNGIKFSGDGYNKTKNADPNVGDHAVYNVNVPAAQTKAQLLMKFNRKDKVVAFSAPSGDQSPSYVLDPETGKTTETKYGWRYKLFVNDVEVEFTPYTTENPEPETVAKKEVEFAFPCTLALQAGNNKIELQKWGGYTATIVDFTLVY